jgi:hypothetical protein
VRPSHGRPSGHRPSVRPLSSACQPWQALHALPKGKTPGLHGLPVEFFLDMWDIVKDDLLAIYLEALLIGYMYRDLNTGTLCLLPKGGDQTSLKHWHLIMFLGKVCKLLAKTMARRLQPLLDQVV